MDLEYQFIEIIFGSKIKINVVLRKVLEFNIFWNNIVLGGFLKINVKFYELSEVVVWFEEYLMFMVYVKIELDEFVIVWIKEGVIDKVMVVSILKKVDFNVLDILFEDKELLVLDGLIDFLESQMKEWVSGFVKVLREKGKIILVDVELQYRVGGVQFCFFFEMELEGIKWYYGFVGLLVLLFKDEYIILIDELEFFLYLDLYLYFILFFLINVEKLQLLAIINYWELLDNWDVF